MTIGKTKVSIIDPEEMVATAKNENLRPIAQEVKEKLQKVLKSI